MTLRSRKNSSLKITATIFCTLGFLALPAPGANASQLAVEEFHKSAYSGKFKSGIDRLQTMAGENPDDVEAQFGKGILQFFAALKNMQEGFYRHSVDIGRDNKTFRDLRRLIPYMAFPGTGVLLPTNPDAQTMTYKSLRAIFTRFVDDLQIAEASLARVGDRPTKLPIEPFKIAVDLNHDGSIAPSERLMGAVLGGGRGRRGRNSSRMERMSELTIAFDTADASWLRGYANVLMATTNMLLAFDFEKSYETIAHNYYGPDATKFGQELARHRPSTEWKTPIQAKLDVVNKRLAEIARTKSPSEQFHALNEKLRTLPRTKPNAKKRQQILKARSAIPDNYQRLHSQRGKLHFKKKQLTRELTAGNPADQYSEIFDLVAYVHSMNWRVIEPERLRAVRSHLLKVATLNHVTWRLIRAETDNDREWLPNAGQTSPFGARRLTDDVIDSWLATMKLSEQVLNGEKLLPHPRFEKGVNLKKFFETAREVDFILMITGHSILPYLEEGEIVDKKSWNAITGPLRGDMLIYALWFN